MGFNERFIIVEDMQFIADGVREGLEAAGHIFAGYAPDLATAHELIETADFSVAVVDGSLGKGGLGKGGCADGIEADNAIRRKNERLRHEDPGVPEKVVVAFTTNLPQETTYGSYYVGKTGSKMIPEVVAAVTNIPRPSTPGVSGK